MYVLVESHDYKRNTQISLITIVDNQWRDSTYGITNGKVVALRAEDRHQSRPGVVQWSRDEQTNDEHSKEDKRLRDQHGQQKGPVDFVPIELHQW